MINATQIRKVLSSAAFNPKDKSGPLAIIVDVDNSDYYMRRATELIREGLEMRNPSDTLLMAIRLLALTIAKEEKEPASVKRKSKPNPSVPEPKPDGSTPTG